VRANGQVAFGCFRWESAARCYTAHSLDVVTLDGARVGHVTAFLDDTVLGRFGLPRTLPAG
jgi:RNA polymerase sigma-70 factor (ECF subfamily)